MCTPCRKYCAKFWTGALLPARDIWKNGTPEQTTGTSASVRYIAELVRYVTAGSDQAAQPVT